ncbi:serine hydrolase [Pontibacter roseus]|nr:serine hydrolase [Pontibacter roseus]
MQPDSPFYFASTNKLLVAPLVLRLPREGGLRLDEQHPGIPVG